MDTATLDWRDNRQYQTDSTKLWDILYGDAIFKALAELDGEFGYDTGWRSWLAADVANEIKKRLVGDSLVTTSDSVLRKELDGLDVVEVIDEDREHQHQRYGNSATCGACRSQP